MYRLPKRRGKIFYKNICCEVEKVWIWEAKALLWRSNNFAEKLGGQILMGDKILNNFAIKFVHIIRNG